MLFVPVRCFVGAAGTVFEKRAGFFFSVFFFFGVSKRAEIQKRFVARRIDSILTTPRIEKHVKEFILVLSFFLAPNSKSRPFSTPTSCLASIKYNTRRRKTKSTLNEIMFVNTKAAFKFAEECAARKMAAKEREERSSGEFMAETKSGDSDTVSVRSESTWLSDRNEKSKSEAMTMIEETIKTQEVRKIAVAESIEHNTQIGLARLESTNERGTP
jgi:hypothetical protein